ncbi:porin family protein [Colwelliaceae bacterium MEBiC 14330]
MKKIALSLPIMIPSLLLSAPALSQQGFYSELYAGSVKNKAEIDGSLTNSVTYLGNTETTTQSYSDTQSYDSTSLGLRLGYQFNEYIAIEAGYHNYGKAKDNYIDEFDDTINEKISSSAVSFGIKGSLSISDHFSIFARTGMAKWDFKASVTDSSMPGEVEKLKESDKDIYYGIGAEYRFNETISLGVEYSVLSMGWKDVESEYEQYYDVDYSYSLDRKVDYKVQNIALLLKISF